MYNGWTESEEAIEARKQRILASLKQPARRGLLADVRKYRKDVLIAGGVSMLVSIVLQALMGNVRLP